MTKCIVLICGPPACLKSTLIKILRLIFNEPHVFNLRYICIKKLAQIQRKSSRQYKFLSFDDLFFDYENDIIENEFNWKIYRSLIANGIENLILSNNQENSTQFNLTYSSEILYRLYQILGNFQDEHILFIEDNFYYSSMRHRYYQIAQRAQIGFLVIHLYANISIAIERNEKRDIFQRVSNRSIENIYSKYEFLSDDFIVDTTERGLTSEHLNQILQRIEYAYQHPIITINDEQQRQIETEINEKNFLYQSDQKLRKFISKYLKQEFETNEKYQSNNEKKLYAEMINNKRQEFLELLRQKILLLDSHDNIEDIFQEFLFK